MRPRVMGSWFPLTLSTLSLLGPEGAHWPTANDTAHASAGIYVSSIRARYLCRYPGLHRNRRVVSETVSRNYRGSEGFWGSLGDSSARIYGQTEQRRTLLTGGVAHELLPEEQSAVRQVKRRVLLQILRAQRPDRVSNQARYYQLHSATASFSITTFKCAVTSLCNFTGMVNSPKVFSGSWIWILRRSTLNPFFISASATSPEVTDPKS